MPQISPRLHLGNARSRTFKPQIFAFPPLIVPKKIEPMNAKIRQILQKHTRSVCKEPGFKIRKECCPDMIDPCNSSIRLQKDHTFYTFDGRIINLNAKSTILSVPDETKDVLSVVVDDARYLFFLNTKNKLEVARCEADGSIGEKSVLTRNVVGMGVCGSEVVYVFRKNKTIYTNIACIDNGKWIGKRYMSEVSGENVELFCCESTFFIILDGSVIRYPGLTLCSRASFVHQDRDDLIVGYKDEADGERVKYTFRIYDATTAECDKEAINSVELEVSRNHEVKGHKDIVAIRDDKTLIFLQINEHDLKTVYVREEEAKVYAFDFVRNEDEVDVLLLAERVSADEGSLSFESLRSAIDKSEACESVVSEPIPPSTAHSIELLPEASLTSPEMPPVKRKNPLFDEVKESEEQRKEGTKSFQSLAMQTKLKTDGSKAVRGPSKKQIRDKECVDAAERLQDEKKSDFQSALRDAFVVVFQKNEVFIKDLIAKVIVPPLEAAINEMRIQVLAEVKKTLTSVGSGAASGDQMMNFKRKLAAGDVNEGLKGIVLCAKDDEVEGYLVHVTSDMFEDVEADVLADLSVKLWNILKKSRSETLLRILLEVLASIDITELSIEKVQALNVLLRYCRDTEQVNETYPGMTHVAYLMLRKIEKHTKSLSLKL